MINGILNVMISLEELVQMTSYFLQYWRKFMVYDWKKKEDLFVQLSMDNFFGTGGSKISYNEKLPP